MREVQRATSSSVAIHARATHLIRTKKARKEEINRIQRLTRNALETRQNAIVSSAISKHDVERVMRIINRRSPGPTNGRSRIAHALAEATAPLLLRAPINGVILTGGEMAKAFLQQTKARQVRLETEMFPGIALGTVVGGYADGVRIVTKAGGFGKPDSLIRIMQRLSGQRTAK